MIGVGRRGCPAFSRMIGVGRRGCPAFSRMIGVGRWGCPAFNLLCLDDVIHRVRKRSALSASLASPIPSRPVPPPVMLTAGANIPIEGREAQVTVRAPDLGGVLVLAEEGGAVRPL